MSLRVMIFVPAYNCQHQIARTLSKIDPQIQQYIEEIVVVDNQSADRTLEEAIRILKTLKIRVTVLRNHKNYSLGGSTKRAFLYAIENQYDYVVTLHGDDQADIRDFLPVFRNKSYIHHDLVIGARFHPDSTLQGYSRVRILGNRVLNTICGFINRKRIDDMIAGITCFRVSFLKNKFFLNFPNNLTFDAHVLLYALHHRAKILYVPISWREEDQISNAKVVTQALIILRLFLRYLIWREKVFSVNASGQAAGFNYPSEVVFQQ